MEGVKGERSYTQALSKLKRDTQRERERKMSNGTKILERVIGSILQKVLKVKYE